MPDYKYLKVVSVDSKAKGIIPSNMALFLVYGKITAIDAKTQSYTVKMPKPDPKKNEWRGMRYWEEVKEKWGLDYPTGPVGHSPGEDVNAECKQLYYGDDATRTFNLTIDDFCELSVDGLPANYDEASVGNKIVFCYYIGSENDHKHPNYKPAYVYVVTNKPVK
jgi:hypothetical protein